jgi:hypothetical protein
MCQAENGRSEQSRMWVVKKDGPKEVMASARKIVGGIQELVIWKANIRVPNVLGQVESRGRIETEPCADWNEIGK